MSSGRTSPTVSSFAATRFAVVDNLSTGKRENVSRQARFSEIDTSSGCEEVFEDFEPEALSHQAAQMDVMRSVRGPHFDAEVNVLGTIGLLQNCVECSMGNVVFVSTGGAVYGEQREFLATEDHPRYLLYSYEVSKLAAERICTTNRARYTASTTLPCAPATSDGAAAL